MQVLNEHDLKNMKRWDRYEGMVGMGWKRWGTREIAGGRSSWDWQIEQKAKRQWREVISNVQIPFSTAADEILPLR